MGVRKLSGNSNFFQNQGLLKKLPQAYSGYFEDNFFEHNTKLGKKGILGQPHSERLQLIFGLYGESKNIHYWRYPWLLRYAEKAYG